jgi:hypothetical protein
VSRFRIRAALLPVLLGWLVLLGGPQPLRAQTPKHNCDFCHTLVTIPKDVDIHNGPKHTAATSCWNCHNHEGEAGSNLSMIPTTITTPNSGDKSVTFTATSGTNSYADGDATYDGVCEVCHTGTDQHRNDGSAGQHNAGNTCITCHGHDGGFAGSGACRDCHASAQGSRRAILAELSRPSHHVSWADSVKTADCEACHDQSQHQQGSVRLKDADGGSAIVLTGDPASDSAQAAKLTSFCLACHDSDGAGGWRSPVHRWGDAAGDRCHCVDERLAQRRGRHRRLLRRRHLRLPCQWPRLGEEDTVAMPVATARRRGSSWRRRIWRRRHRLWRRRKRASASIATTAMGRPARTWRACSRPR